MTSLTRSIALMIGLLAFAFAGAATAQENLDAGKTPAQLFASDCAICHKTTRGLSHVRGGGGLDGFLREHYTASRESAAMIAGYLHKVDRGPLPSKHRRTAKSPHKKRIKAAEQKPAAKKAAAKKSSKPGEAKATDHKPSATKPTEIKTGAAKPADKKPEAGKDEAMAVPVRPAKPRATNGEASLTTSAVKPGRLKNAKPVE